MGGDSKSHSTGVVTDDPSTGDDLVRGSDCHSACPGRSGYGSTGATATGELHGKGCRGGGGQRTPRGCFLRGRRCLGGGTVGTRRGVVSSSSAIAGIASFSGRGGEGGRGGAPGVAQEGHILGTTARSIGVRPGHGGMDDFTVGKED